MNLYLPPLTKAVAADDLALSHRQRLLDEAMLDDYYNDKQSIVASRLREFEKLHCKEQGTRMA